MLDTDLCLAYKENNRPVKAGRDKCCAWLVEFGTRRELCGSVDADDCGSIERMEGQAAKHVKQFAESEEAWLETLQVAWSKATANGFTGLRTLEDLCPVK